MNSQPRLHLARIATSPCDPFIAIFATCAEAARRRLSQHTLDLAALWDFAQYLDLVDAGYGSKADSFYRIVMARCQAYLGTHSASPAVRSLCARTCTLAHLLQTSMDREADGLADEPFSEALAA